MLCGLTNSSKVGKFKPHRANCNVFLATCKKSKYTGMAQCPEILQQEHLWSASCNFVLCRYVCALVCYQALKPGGTTALLPHDLVITWRMERQFRSPTGELMHKEGNVYFHVNINCVRRKQPYYDPRRMICPEWLVQHLTVEHHNLIQSLTQSA